MTEKNEKVTVSVLLEPKVVEQLEDLQATTRIFSRSKLLREVIGEGLKVLEKEAK